MSWRLRVLSRGLLCLLLAAGLLAAPRAFPVVSQWANASSLTVTALASGVAWCSASLRNMEAHVKCYPSAKLRKWLP